MMSITKEAATGFYWSFVGFCLMLMLVGLIVGCNPDPKPPSPVPPPVPWPEPNPPPPKPTPTPVPPVPPKPDPPKPPDPTPPQPLPTPAPEIPENLKSLAKLHYAARDERGLQQITIHNKLMEAAQKHAEWMADNRRMSHTGANRSSFWDRIRSAGYRGSGGGENIAAGYRTPEAVFNGWMGSRGHRNNILGSSWEHFGLGESNNYWCAVFAYGDGKHGAAAEDPVILELPPPLEK